MRVCKTRRTCGRHFLYPLVREAGINDHPIKWKEPGAPCPALSMLLGRRRREFNFNTSRPFMLDATYTPFSRIPNAFYEPFLMHKGPQKASFLGCVCKILLYCHSEERSDEESLPLLRVKPFLTKPRPFAIAHIVPMSFGRVT